MFRTLTDMTCVIKLNCYRISTFIYSLPTLQMKELVFNEINDFFKKKLGLNKKMCCDKTGLKQDVSVDGFS